MSVLEIQIEGLPVAWKRMSGKNRFKHDDLREWQEEVKDAAREAIALEGREEAFPMDGPFGVRIEVGVTDTEAKRFLRKDADNIEKGIYDALSGVVWSDDCMRYIPEHSFKVVVGDWDGVVIVVTTL